MKIFSIVKRKRECYGHGHYGDVKYIPRIGAFDSGPYHPFFIFKEEAINYLKANDLYGCEIEAVTLCMGGCEISAPNTAITSRPPDQNSPGQPAIPPTPHETRHQAE